jgi:PDZ domain
MRITLLMAGGMAGFLGVLPLRTLEGRVQDQCDGRPESITRRDLTFSCNCELRTDGLTRDWDFYSEPRIERVGAMSGSRLLAGDILVAVSGHPIATHEGSRAFSAFERGEAATLLVTREGRVVTLQAPASPHCEVSFPSLRRAPATLDTVPVQGYLGFGIAAHANAHKAPGQPVVWNFLEPPVVTAIDDDGPARRAGLLPGDTLTHIDGVLITSETGGRRFGAIRPGQEVAFGFRRNGETGISTIVAVERSARPNVAANEAIESLNRGLRRDPADVFTGRLQNVVIEVTGPARVERVGDRFIVQTADGEVTVVVREVRQGR